MCEARLRIGSLRVLVAALVALACVGCGLLRLVRPAPDEESLPVVRDLEPVHAVLQAADDASARLLLSEIGRTNTPGAEMPVWRMVYRAFRPDLKTVLLLAGVHGNETAGVECALKVVQALASATPTTAPYDLDIIPLLNPWGYIHDAASAPGGVDIATDFTSFESHEARLLRRYLREKRYDLVVDLREDSTAQGFSIWQYGLPDTTVAQQAVDRVRAAGYPIENPGGVGFLRARNGIVEAPMWGLTLLRLTREMTIAGYIRGGGVSTVVFTVVTPAGLPLNDRAAMHRIAVDTLVDAYAVPSPDTEKRPSS